MFNITKLNLKKGKKTRALKKKKAGHKPQNKMA